MLWSYEVDGRYSGRGCKSRRLHQKHIVNMFREYAFDGGVLDSTG